MAIRVRALCLALRERALVHVSLAEGAGLAVAVELADVRGGTLVPRAHQGPPLEAETVVSTHRRILVVLKRVSARLLQKAELVAPLHAVLGAL